MGAASVDLPTLVVSTGPMLNGKFRGRDIEELARRAAHWQRTRPPQKYSRGYYRLYIEHVTQADRGCDLDFLVGASGSTVERESH